MSWKLHSHSFYMYKSTRGHSKVSVSVAAPIFLSGGIKNYVNFNVIKHHLKENVCQKKEESYLYDIIFLKGTKRS